jgi:hypothetical protein
VGRGDLRDMGMKRKRKDRESGSEERNGNRKFLKTRQITSVSGIGSFDLSMAG